MTPNNRALAVLDKAIVLGLSCDASKRPGVVIAKLSDADRAALRDLQADDAANHRPIFLS